MVSEADLIGGAVALALLAGGAVWLEHRGAEHERGVAQQASLERARLDAKVTEQRVEDQARIAHDATVQADTARAAAASSAHAAAALRVQLAAYVTHARAADPTASSASEADPIGVLAEVLGSADDFAGRVAAEADANRIAGLACERAYDALTP